jgi:hypothetical protein
MAYLALYSSNAATDIVEDVSWCGVGAVSRLGKSYEAEGGGGRKHHFWFINSVNFSCVILLDNFYPSSSAFPCECSDTSSMTRQRQPCFANGAVLQTSHPGRGLPQN